MAEPLHDLLRDRLIRTRAPDGAERAETLPGIFARLGGDDIASFPALQPHQSHAWFAFLVQLAGIALHRAGETDPALPEAAWAERLLALTAGAAEPWSLVVPGLDRPAFLQPPVPEGTLDGFKNRIEHPDALDVLVTTKLHDVKSARIAEPDPEHWVYALVSLQTMQGFSGRDNYGVVRMNGGFGNRPCVAYTPSLSWGPRFRRDLAILLAERPKMVAGYGYAHRDGVALQWLEPWDGRTAIPLSRCDPFFIEVCRRVRFEGDSGGRVVARIAPSKTKRTAVPVDNGDTGDPWTPLRHKDNAALTLDGSGFTYRRLHQLLFGNEFRLGAAGRVQRDDPERLLLVARAMVRGQGKTEGLHERVVEIPGHVRSRLADPDEFERLAAVAKQRIEIVAQIDRQILNPALCVLLQGGPDKARLDDKRTRRWRDRFDAAVDAEFFHSLWGALDDLEDSEIQWVKLLHRLAKVQLEDAIRSAPIPDARRYRAVAAAERVFGGGFRNRFPEVFQSNERSADELAPTA
ncbi:MAG TPA: type I-E CRISPR-associated protein Cse1/CasA [Longimicrobiales bacterium]